MKKKILILIAFFLCTMSYSQNRYTKLSTSSYSPPNQSYSSNKSSLTCNQMISAVTNNYDEVKFADIDDSSWLLNATYYKLEEVGFVIANIKTNDYDLKGKSYIFCGVNYTNWALFKQGGQNSWGESFHDYIFLKKHNCGCQ